MVDLGNLVEDSFFETLMPLLLDVEEYNKAKKSVKFKSEIDYYFKNYIGRPSPLYFGDAYQATQWS